MSNTIPLHTLLDAHIAGGTGYASIIETIRAALTQGQEYVFTDLEGRAAHRFLTLEQFIRWINYFEGRCLVDDLERVGVRVCGRDPLLKALVSAHDWREEFTILARIGTAQGITLASTAPDKFNELVPALQALLQASGFTSKQAFAIQDNVSLTKLA